jgi:thiamine phosphate synthase YjbQ (UPF0047 family)
MKINIPPIIAILPFIPSLIQIVDASALFGNQAPLAAFSTPASNVPRVTKSNHANVSSKPICSYYEVQIPTSQKGPPRQAISVEDLTPTITSILKESGMQHGSMNVISRHTTTAITINERESRLAKDMSKYLLSLAPPDERSSAEAAQKDTQYFHNDIDERPDSAEEAQRCRENGWDIDDPVELQKWRDQEPINAHSHLLSMLLGSSETIPIVDGEMVIGQVRFSKEYLLSKIGSEL